MKPILFNTDMVRAILAGRKTMTRQVMKPQPEGAVLSALTSGEESRRMLAAACAPHRPGEILYVRERFAYLFGRYVYRADYDKVTEESKPFWKPSIHMPREAARIFLRVTDVRVERLKDMNATSAMDEGFTDWNEAMRVWNSAIKPADRDKYGWDANPWVWVISFERVSKEVQ